MIAPPEHAALGIVDGPAGALLLPPAEDATAYARVVRGRFDALPAAWAFYLHAVNGERDAALDALAAFGDDPLAAYDRFVLTGDPDRYAALAPRLTGDRRLLLEAAAYAHGAVDDAPDPRRAADPHVGAYLVLAVGDGGSAAAAAERVCGTSGVLAARLFDLAAASTQADAARTDATLAALERARALLADTGLRAEAADLALRFGLLAHERADGRRDRLLAAVHAYQRALQTFAKDGPYRRQFALAQMNLGLAYLALPMNDEAERLRPAIAIQSLREAATALDPREAPDLWAGATLNLANALQHARSTHVEENLWEAVALYADILPVIGDGDPVRKARVLANQANALAHLGAFSRAIPRLHEARAIFALTGDADSTAAIDATLDEIATRSPTAQGAHGAL